MKAIMIGKRVLAVVLTALCFLSGFAVWKLSPTVSAAYENTYVNTGNQSADLIGVAKTQLGYAEGSNNYNKYAESFGNAYAPWCGYFISWCARQANIPTSIIPTSGSSSSFFTIGTYHSRTSGYTPQPGDIMLYGTYGNAYHVSIVEYYDAASGKVHVLDGNWSDKVSSHSTTLSNTEVAGFTTPLYTSSSTELAAYNIKAPSTLAFGKSFSISGYIGSPNNITNVTVSITDAAGKTVVSASAAPNSKGYDINGLDAKIPFGSLDVGTYTFVVTAKDTAQTKRWAYPFEVVSSIKMTIADVAAPTTLTPGSIFRISGVITCTEALSTVSVSVYNSAGVYQTGGTAAPGTTTYNISGVDNYVSFGKLAAGTYTMTVTARSANGSGKWEYPFTVAPTIDLAGQTYPTTLDAGGDIAVKGVITCSENLTKVTAEVLSGTTAVLSASAAPNAKTYDLSALDSKLAFATLATGSFTYRITAVCANGTKEWTYAFTVAAPDCTLDGEVHPSVSEVGKDAAIAGTLTCTENLTDVTVSVKSGETAVLSASAVPNAKTYDLSALDSELSFASLAVGTYTYCINAVSANGAWEWTYDMTVTGPVITLDNAVYPDDIMMGQDATIGGTLSCEKPITSVTVSVIAANGNVIASAAAAPNANTYDLSALDASIGFIALPAGTYTYRIDAAGENSSGVWEETFTVTKAAVRFSFVRPVYPKSITQGSSFSISGTVSASEAINKVTVAVTGENGATVLSASAAPNALNYDVSGLDSQITFGKLAVGSYTYCVEAVCANGSECFEYPFTVTAVDVEFTLADPVVPTAIDVGASFSVSGTVEATQTLTYVGISAVNQAGETVIKSENTAPGGTTFRIGLLDVNMTFGVLPQGRYTYVVTAKAGGETETWEYPFTVGDVADVLLGDITLDGKVNLIDSMTLYQAVSGRTSLSAEQLAAAGVETVNMLTVSALYGYVSGKTSTYP